MAWWLFAGNHCSWWRFVMGSLICLLLLQLYSFYSRVGVEVDKLRRILALHPLPLQDLEQVEEMILLPPYGLKYPERINLNDEFLNSSSLARRIFFPRGSIDPGKDANRSYYPGKVWLDTNGNPIQAHGGGILHDEKTGLYYWYGEYKDGPTYRANGTGTSRVDVIGVACYSSMDLWAWKYEGIVLAAEQRDETHDLYTKKVLERPKVVFNERTGKYVMWMHIDDSSYKKASAGVAISDSPTGHFKYIHSLRPNGFDSRDLTVFKDENSEVYLIYSSVRNKEIHISPLTEDYLNVTNKTVRALVGQHREAPAVLKHEGLYYMITSGCSGWAPNEAMVHEAESMFGPWESIGNPCVGANKEFRVATFFSQGTYVIPMLGGLRGTFIFMADRWNKDDLGDSRYVWLPLVVRARKSVRYVGLPLWSKVSIFWHDKWTIRHGIGQNVDII